MNHLPPCQYLEHTYDQAELHDFALYCMKKYDQQFYGKFAKLPWSHIGDKIDQIKLKTILKELHDIFDSICQPLVWTNLRIFYLDPHGVGGIHKDPAGGNSFNQFSYAKWAVNIPAVESDCVDLEFFEDLPDNNETWCHGNQRKDPFCMPDFYKKYIEAYPQDPFKMGSLPEEQIIPTYKESFTDTILLDTTVWHRSKSRTDKLSVRFQYMAKWDIQKSYTDTVNQLKHCTRIM
jgi:hypothetical protein